MERKGFIGGSDAAVILGISPWKTPLELYREKTGQSEAVETSEAMYWGTLLEDVIAQEYARRVNVQVMVREGLIRHPHNEWMGAHVDRLVQSGDKTYLLECKNSRTSQGWGEPYTDQIPAAYYAQVQHYLAVTGYALCDVAVLIGGSDYRIYSVNRDEKYIDELIRREYQFWQQCQRNIAPAPSALSDMDYTLEDPGTIAIADESIERKIDYYKLLQGKLKADQKELDIVKLEILQAIGTATEIRTPENKTLATWKTQSSGRFDSKLFKRDHPELAGQYEKKSNYRVLRIKGGIDDEV